VAGKVIVGVVNIMIQANGLHHYNVIYPVRILLINC